MFGTLTALVSTAQRATSITNFILKCANGGTFLLKCGNDGTLSTVTNTAGL
jgi:hypothetical protein